MLVEASKLQLSLFILVTSTHAKTQIVVFQKQEDVAYSCFDSCFMFAHSGKAKETATWRQTSYNGCF